jgi:hypothetical protein
MSLVQTSFAPAPFAPGPFPPRQYGQYVPRDGVRTHFRMVQWRLLPLHARNIIAASTRMDLAAAAAVLTIIGPIARVHHFHRFSNYEREFVSLMDYLVTAGATWIEVIPQDPSAMWTGATEVRWYIRGCPKSYTVGTWNTPSPMYLNGSNPVQIPGLPGLPALVPAPAPASPPAPTSAAVLAPVPVLRLSQYQRVRNLCAYRA